MLAAVKLPEAFEDIKLETYDPEAAPPFPRISEQRYYEAAKELLLRGHIAEKKAHVIAIAVPAFALHPMIGLNIRTLNGKHGTETQRFLRPGDRLIFDKDHYTPDQAREIAAAIFEEYDRQSGRLPTPNDSDVMKFRITASGVGLWSVDGKSFNRDYEAGDNDEYHVRGGTGRLCLPNTEDFNMLTTWGDFNMRAGGTLAARLEELDEHMKEEPSGQIRKRAGLIKAVRAIDEGRATIREALFTTDKDGALRTEYDIYGMDPGFYKDNYKRVPIPMDIARPLMAYRNGRPINDLAKK